MSVRDFFREENISRITRSVWLFPVLLLVIVVLLSTFRVSGSSIGELSRFLIPTNTQDSSLLFNSPRNLRSDEWSVNTPLISSQQQNGYALYSEQLGLKDDTAVVSDLPAKDWTMLFKPQNIAFLVGIPFDNAFAFRWWIMGYILIISAYFFVLHLFPKKQLLAIVVSLTLFFAPIIQWWYQNINILLFAYSLLSLLLFMKLIDLDKKAIRQKIAHTAGLTWSLLSFAFILYPPYQIPLIYVMLAAMIGYILSRHNGRFINLLKENSVYFVGIVVTAGIIVAGFYVTHHETLHALSNTSYPGSRHILAGGFPVGHIISPQLAPIFTNETKSANYYPNGSLNNSSESSQIGFPTLTVILLGLATIFVLFKRSRRVPWMIVSMLFVIFAILARLFIPHFNFIYKLAFIDAIPHQRLMLGLGFAILLLALFTAYELVRSKTQLSRSEIIVINTLNAALSVILLAFIYIKLGWLLEGESIFIASLAVTVPVLFCLFVTMRHYTLGFVVVLLFVFVSTVSVNPLYVGFGPSKDSAVSNYIHKLSVESPSKRWVTDINNIWQLESLVLTNGGKSLSGIYVYPQNDLWKSLDSSNEARNAYNRFAHVTFTIDSGESTNTTLKYEGFMQFIVKTTPCSDFLSKNNVRYVLTVKPVTSNCGELLEKFSYPHQTFYIYRLKTSS